jgi:hypothetical protein
MLSFVDVSKLSSRRDFPLDTPTGFVQRVPVPDGPLNLAFLVGSGG